MNFLMALLEVLSGEPIMVGFIVIIAIVIFSDQLWQLLVQHFPKIFKKKQQIVSKPELEIEPESEKPFLDQEFFRIFMDLYVRQTKIVFLFSEHINISKEQYEPFVLMLKNIIVTNRDKNIFFDLSKTNILNNNTVEAFKDIINEEIKKGAKIYFILPPIEIVTENGHKLIKYITQKIEQEECLNLTAKFDDRVDFYIDKIKLITHTLFTDCAKSQLRLLNEMEIPHISTKSYFVLAGYTLYLAICKNFKKIIKDTEPLNILTLIQANQNIIKDISFILKKNNVPTLFINQWVDDYGSIFESFQNVMRLILKSSWYPSDAYKINAILDIIMFLLDYQRDNIHTIYFKYCGLLKDESKPMFNYDELEVYFNE